MSKEPWGQLPKTAQWALRMIATRLANDKFTGQIVLNCAQSGVALITWKEPEKPRELD